MRRVAPPAALVVGLLLVALGWALPALAQASGATPAHLAPKDGSSLGSSVGSGVGVAGIELSRDGRTWGPVLDAEDGFGGTPTWRPGESRAERVFVRRIGEGTRDLSLQLTHMALSDVSGALLGEGYLEVTARVGEGDWAPVDLASPQQGIHVDDAAPATAVPIELRATISKDATGPVHIDAQALAFGMEALAVLAPEHVAAPSSGPMLGLAPIFFGVAIVAVAVLLIWQRRRIPG